MIPSQDSRQRFVTTQWSMVMRLDAPQAADAREALVRLCLRYWYPVYAYVRRSGHSAAIANDITRAFLQHILEDFRREGAAPANGQFRSYLLARLHAFLNGEWSEAIASEAAPEFMQAPPDLEKRYMSDSAATESPDQAYQRSFALELLARAFGHLREEALQTGRLEMYEALEAYVAQDPPPAAYEELGQQLRLRPLALIVALKRLRQRFRELIDTELADTVSSAEEMLAEQQALFAVLSEMV